MKAEGGLVGKRQETGDAEGNRGEQDQRVTG